MYKTFRTESKLK